MTNNKLITCCFSGYRIEKMPFSEGDNAQKKELEFLLYGAITKHISAGYRHFISGMSTGFDLWAAEAVLQLKQTHEISLFAAVPFEKQAQRFSPYWKKLFDKILVDADKVFLLSDCYHAGCYAERNRFMVDSSSALICYYTGLPGGTAQTIRMAKSAGHAVTNLAETQLSLDL